MSGMRFFCPNCGCEMDTTQTPVAGGKVEVAVAGCHCGPFGIQDTKPKDAQKTPSCPVDGPDMRRAGIFS